MLPHIEDVLFPGDLAKCCGQVVSVAGVTYVDPIPVKSRVEAIRLGLGVDHDSDELPTSWLALACVIDSSVTVGQLLPGAYCHFWGRWDGEVFHLEEAVPFTAAEDRERRAQHFYKLPRWMECSLSVGDLESLLNSIPGHLEEQVMEIAAPSDGEPPTGWGLRVLIHHMTPEWKQYAEGLPKGSCAVVPLLSVAHR
ncbi:hypothetical protein [Raineyella sp. W15-4]|uniref:hypothetical protein n=1 Tax=Raineyella sp. W15-4 TaxID=3081651 RepID=UPI0029535C45|nr:hypothetical protein [Raineyella sp. W15-4]WOQ17139.1 hypothetical protein R0145_00060 [Raineyella sp. W15-4]